MRKANGGSVTKRSLLTAYRVARRLARGTPVQGWKPTARMYEWVSERATRGIDRLEIDFHGARVVVPADDKSMSLALLSGTYDPVFTSRIRDSLDAGSSFLDVGANVGLYSSMAARRVGPGGCIAAVEPMARSRELLELNLSRNPGPRTEVIPAAAGASNGILTVHVTASSMGTTSSLATGGAHEEVPMVRLDDALQGQRFDVVKIDVEGFELQVLLGMPDLLAGGVRLLALEYSQNEYADDLRRFLAGSYEHLWICDERRGQLVSVKPEDLSRFERVNVLASNIRMF